MSRTKDRCIGAARMAPLARILAVACLLLPCFSYVDLGQGQVNTPDYIPRIAIPRPWQLPPDEEMQIDTLPSMITAIAPSTTMASNGTFETMYSMHYHDYFVRSRQGTGIFKRGVFASDPPIATCTPCGFQGTIATPNTTGMNTSPTATCTLHTYLVCIRILKRDSNANMTSGCLPILRRCCWHNKHSVLLRFELFWCLRVIHHLNDWTAVLFYHPCVVSIECQCQHVVYVHNWCFSLQHHDAVSQQLHHEHSYPIEFEQSQHSELDKLKFELEIRFKSRHDEYRCFNNGAKSSELDCKFKFVFDCVSARDSFAAQ